MMARLTFTCRWPARRRIGSAAASAVLLLAFSAHPGWALTAVQLAELTAADSQPAAVFGLAVAVDGDTAVVGAPGYSAGASFTGGAFVFTRDAGKWTRQALLVASDRGARDFFGSSVAIHGDTVLIGSQDDANGELAGAAYVFTRSAGTWVEQSKLLPADGAAGDLFGASVSLHGSTALIGAHQDHTVNGRFSGSAYVFTRANGVWRQQAKLLPAGAGPTDAFGWSVAIDSGTAVIGAINDDDKGSNSGAAYVFTRSAGSWNQQAKLRAPDGAEADGLGEAVAIDGDTVVAGAPGDDDRRTSSGSAYVFVRDGAAWHQQSKLLAEDGDLLDMFGAAVAIDRATVVVGARLEGDGGANSGAAYAFTRRAGVWRQTAKILPVEDAAQAQFGHSVGLAGRRVVVGAPFDVGNGELSGAVFAFQLVPEGHIQCPGDVDGDGSRELVVVSGHGDVVVTRLDGSRVNQFSLSRHQEVTAVALMADSNGNGAAELVALGQGGNRAEVRDLLTGAELGLVGFSADAAAIDVAVVPDHDGNGIAELASLVQRPVMVEVADSMTGQAVSSVRFHNYVVPRDLLVLADVDGNGTPELAVLGDHKRQNRSDKLEIRDLTTGNALRELWFGTGWHVLQQASAGDGNNNGHPDVAVLRWNAEPAVNVALRDSATGQWLGSIGFSPHHQPIELLTLADLDGNRAREIAVFGRRRDGRNQKAEIRDSASGALLREIYFDRNFFAQDAAVCSDLDGNRREQIAMLGRRGDGRLIAIVKDAATGDRVARVRLWSIPRL